MSARRMEHDRAVLSGNQVPGQERRTVVNRLAPVLIALATLLSVAACTDDEAVGSGEVVDGPSQAAIDDEPPYGVGARVGETYEYTLYTHCGIEWTRIDGVWWRASTPLSDGNANPPSGWGNPYDEGEMEIVDESTATFQGGPTDVEFERTDKVDAPFTCA